MQKGTAAVAGLFTVAALAGWASAKPASANAAAAPPPTPGATVGEGTPLQSRPIPAWSTLSEDGKLAYLDTERQQLHFLANVFGDSTLDPGMAVATTSAAAADALGRAVTSFVNQDFDAVTAYGYAPGGDATTNLVAAMNAVDDAARDAYPSGAAAQAPDYRAPRASSGVVAVEPSAGVFTPLALGLRGDEDQREATEPRRELPAWLRDALAPGRRRLAPAATVDDDDDDDDTGPPAARAGHPLMALRLGGG